MFLAILRNIFMSLELAADLEELGVDLGVLVDWNEVLEIELC